MGIVAGGVGTFLLPMILSCFLLAVSASYRTENVGLAFSGNVRSFTTFASRLERVEFVDPVLIYWFVLNFELSAEDFFVVPSLALTDFSRLSL
jgi:hypothetical protein